MRKLEDIRFKISKKTFLNKLTGNLGKVEVTDDKIICYCDSKKIDKKYNLDLSRYKITFPSFKDANDEELVKYDCNKPLYYVVDGIEFYNKLIFYADSETTVIFRNCSFNKQILIEHAGKVIFENNKYFDRYQMYYSVDKFLTGKANVIKFINDNFVNSHIDLPGKFGMELVADYISFINCNVDMKRSDEDLVITADTLQILDSIFSCPSIYLIANQIQVDNSKIVASDGIIIEEKSPSNENNNSIISSIVSNNITYNNQDYSKSYAKESLRYFTSELFFNLLRDAENNSTVTTNLLKSLLNSNRIRLINQLTKIRDICIEINNQDLKKERQRLNQKTIGQIKK